MLQFAFFREQLHDGLVVVVLDIVCSDAADLCVDFGINQGDALLQGFDISAAVITAQDSCADLLF